MHFVQICPDAIAWDDRTFEIRSFKDPVRLRDSLGGFGILDPPWVRITDGPAARPAIVDGFKRLWWARQNGIREIHCILLPENLSLPEIWERRIEKKLFEGGINPAEKARIAEVLLSLYPGEDPPGHFLLALDISPRRGNLSRWAILAQDSPATLEMLASGEIADRAALETAEWDRESRTAVMPVLKNLRCSSSIQVEIVERIGEIAIREEISRIAVISDPRVLKILSAGDTNHRQKTQALRDLLSAIRFPRLSRRQERFQQEIKALCLPPWARIIAPPAFEGDNWRLELSFSGPGELRSAIAGAGEIAASNLLDRVFDPDGEDR